MSALVLQPRDRVAIKSGPPLTGTVLGAETDHDERYVVEWDDGLVTSIHVLNLVKLDIEPLVTPAPEELCRAVNTLGGPWLGRCSFLPHEGDVHSWGSPTTFPHYPPPFR